MKYESETQNGAVEFAMIIFWVRWPINYRKSFIRRKSMLLFIFYLSTSIKLFENLFPW